MNNHLSIKVPILARVEGEGALELEIATGKIQRLELKIYEPPRLFEKFLEGRHYGDVLDFVARICGICPVAYQMSAAHAIEQAFQVNPGPWVRMMRRLFYCGEWIESHAMHIHFLAVPDFFGFNSALEMAKQYPEQIRRGLRLQSVGNQIIKLFGGRSVHPVGACIGGFYRAPSLSETENLLGLIENSLNDARELVKWVSSISIPDQSQDFITVALYNSQEYAMNEGQIVSNRGLNITAEEFAQFFHEHQVPYSTALHCLLQEKDYLVGPLARLNINHSHLPDSVQELLIALGLNLPFNNMFLSMTARAIEIYYCLLESQRILRNYQFPSASSATVEPKAGIGFGCTEAPRGMLWHSYELDDNGIVKQARIVPPTSQNQARIEADLRDSLEQYGLDKSEPEIRHRSEMIIRNYDPCISCSTHFLDLRIRRL